MRLIFLNLVAVLFLSACASATDEIPSSTEMKTMQYKEIPGVDEDLLSVDVYYNSDIKARKPVVIWVHGGGWSIGDKANKITDKVKLFTSNNWIFVSVNYRLSPFPYALNDPGRIRFPDHNNDVADAIAWVYNHIAQFGGNPEQLALLGHSAGAHLVSLTGTDRSYLESRGIPFNVLKGVASIDTRAYDIRAMLQTGNPMYLNAFGDDDAELLAASPMYHVQPGLRYPEFFVVKRGSAQRKAYIDAFADKLLQASAAVSLLDASIYDHAGVNEAIGKSGETLITTPLVEFFKACFDEK